MALKRLHLPILTVTFKTNAPFIQEPSWIIQNSAVQSLLAVRVLFDPSIRVIGRPDASRRSLSMTNNYPRNGGFVLSDSFHGQFGRQYTSDTEYDTWKVSVLSSGEQSRVETRDRRTWTGYHFPSQSIITFNFYFSLYSSIRFQKQKVRRLHFQMDTRQN